MPSSLWDKLSFELQDIIFYHAGLDTCLINKRYESVWMLRKYFPKVDKMLSNWTDGVKYGNVHVVKYLFESGCPYTHSSLLVESALLLGKIDLAQFIWDNRTSIRNLLWTCKRQRYNSRLINSKTMEKLVDKKKVESALWLLHNTKEKYPTYCIEKVYDKAIFYETHEWSTLFCEMFPEEYNMFDLEKSDFMKRNERWIDPGTLLFFPSQKMKFIRQNMHILKPKITSD